MLAPILGPVVGGADPPEPALVVDLLRQRPDRRDRDVPRLADAARRPTRARPGRSTGSGLALLPAGAALTIYGISEARLRRAARLAPKCSCRSSPGSCCGVAFCLHALRIPRPLLDVRLYKNKVFAGASFTTFGLGAALFGAMILVPLYYQSVRHLSVIDTGLLNGPQGIGALIMMPIAGPPDRALRRRAGRDLRRLAARAQHDPARVHRREHLYRRDLACCSSAGSASASASCRR